MSETSTAQCPQCGAPLPAGAPAGLCPRCLMALNLQTETVLTDDAQPAQPPLPPEQLAPHFPQLEILECLGRGGMGVVYKARQKTLNRLVALKLLAPERVHDAKFAERFTREAQALAALNHPNIVTIYDFGQAGGYYFLLMELVDGANLRQLLRSHRFTPEEALAIVPTLCDALQYAHDRGIVHRDIKPENLLMDKTGRVKVADFGVAKMLGSVNGGETASPAATENATQAALGTPGYRAPEQKSNPQKVDSRADIYSLGVVFYEMLTGELPGSRIEPPSRKVQVDVRLDEVVLRALEKQPELRFQQASVLKTQVEAIRDSQAGGPEKSPPLPDDEDLIAKYAGRKAWRVFIGMALILMFTDAGDKAWEVFLFAAVVATFCWEFLGVQFTRKKGWTLANFHNQPDDQPAPPAAGLPDPTVEAVPTRLPLSLILAGSYFILLGLYSFGAMAWGPGHSLQLGIFCLPVGIGLLRLRWLWRWYALAWVWIGFACLMFLLCFMFARADGVPLLQNPASVSVGLFGWKPKGAPGVELEVAGFVGQFALLSWIYWVLTRPRIKALFEQHRYREFDRLEPLIVVALLVFTAGSGIPASAIGLIALLFAIIAVAAVWQFKLPAASTHSACGQPPLWRRAFGREPSPWCRMMEFFHRTQLTSPQAIRWMNLSELGFIGFLGSLGALGFVPIPGMKWCFGLSGFSGFFGFFGCIGFAFKAEFAARRKTGTVPAPAPESRLKRRLRKLLMVQLPVAFIVAMVIRTFFLQPFVIQTDVAAPELPRGSRFFVWKPTHTFTPGDMICYRSEGWVNAGRVVSSDDQSIVVNRSGQAATTVPRTAIIGRVVSVFWRTSYIAPATQPASAETWSPELAPGAKPDLQKIREDIKTQMDQTNYEAALGRQLWYFDHALQYGEPDAVRLSFGTMNWGELARNYPKARDALLEIRNQDAQKFQAAAPYSSWSNETSNAGLPLGQPRSRFALFQEMHEINDQLADNDAQTALVKTLVATDPKLARTMGYKTADDAFDTFVKNAATPDVGDGQAAFEAIRQQWESLRKSEVHQAELHEKMQKQMKDFWAQRGQEPPPMATPPEPPKAADRIFEDKTRQLIEILVNHGRKADAEKIRDDALALLDDPWIKCAVTDAEAKAGHPAAPIANP